MPILSFSSNDIDVITGKKTRTIRKAWKTPLKVGDRLYCYWNLVSKEKMKIFEAFVTDIETMKKLKAMMNWLARKGLRILKTC